jgi:NNP family nitrate/nitrite transporter-like MFS transporter
VEWLSDKIGARRVMYWTFICLRHLHLPALLSVDNLRRGGHQRADRVHDLAVGFVPFMVLVFVLGFFMSLGKAAVYKHIPVYYPNNVGAVGGVVGMIGGLGGFILPITFGAMNDLTRRLD